MNLINKIAKKYDLVNGISKKLNSFLNSLIFPFFIVLFQHQASNSKKVYLKGVTLRSTGFYRCEVSAG